MTKEEERANPRSCWNKARDGERLFVMIERDGAMPGTIRDWADRRIRMGFNEPGDAQITEARRLADEIEADHNRAAEG